ncbi:hypothetical protein Chor_012758 [Crotalus horridus]
MGGVRWVSPDLSLALDLGLRLVLQGISILRRATAVSKMKQENIFLFVPNLIGYARIIFAFIAFYYMPTSPLLASFFYLLSGFLDAFDGHAARALNQESALWFQLSMSLDVASHWLHLHSTVVKGGESHKSIRNPILRVYYNSWPVLFIMCAGNELFYCMLYLLCFGEGPEILSGYAGLYRLILWVCTPIAITKSFISLIHLGSASCNMAALDAAERAKKM